MGAKIKFVLSLLLNLSLCVTLYCSGQGPLALKSLAIRTLAHVLLEENFADAIENIKNVFYILHATDIEFSQQDTQSIIDQYAQLLCKLHKPLLLSTIKGDIGNGSTARVVFSNHERYLAIEHEGLFDVKNQEFYPIEGFAHYAMLGFSPHDTYLWQWQSSTREYDTISIWNTQTKQPLRVFNVAKYSTPCISPNEQYVLLKNSDAKLTIYDTKTWTEVSAFLLKSEANNAQFFNNNQLIALPQSSTIGIFVVTTGKQIAHLTGMIFVISPDNKYIATETYDRGHSCLSVYNAHTFELLQVYIRENASWPFIVKFNKASDKILTKFVHRGGYSLWDIEHNRTLFEHLEEYVPSFVMHDMTKVIEDDILCKKTVVLKDIHGELLCTLPIQSGAELSVSPAQTYLLVRRWSGDKLYNTHDFEHKPHTIKVRKQCVISSHDTYYATAGTHTIIRIFVLNIFKHFSLNFKQLLALIIICYALQHNESPDRQALEFLEQSCPQVLHMLTNKAHYT